MNAKYTRLFADERGESHFADVDIPLALADFAPEASLLALSDFVAASRTAFLGGPTGWTSDWHVSSARNLFVVLTGEWEITASDGETRMFAPTSVLLCEDVSGKGHRSRVTSKEASLAVLVELS